jgi:hypothetical protein
MQGIDGRVRGKLASLLFREDAHGKLVLRVTAVERLADRARKSMRRGTMENLFVTRSGDAVRQPNAASARRDIEGAPDSSDPLPGFLIKAQEDARARRALARAVWVFIGTMVTTVVAGLGLFAGFAIFNW